MSNAAMGAYCFTIIWYGFWIAVILTEPPEGWDRVIGRALLDLAGKIIPPAVFLLVAAFLVFIAANHPEVSVEPQPGQELLEALDAAYTRAAK